MLRQILPAFLSCVLLTGLAAGDTDTRKMSYDQAVAALQELLNGSSAEVDTHTPAKVVVSVVADEQGAMIISQTAERDLPDLFFRSTSSQTWKLRASDIDPKRIAMRTEPLSVYAPIKKDERRIQVTRTETKSRVEGGHEPAEDWEDRDVFVTSFVSIPVDTIEKAEQTAALLKQIAKTAAKQ